MEQMFKMDDLGGTTILGQHHTNCTVPEYTSFNDWYNDILVNI